MADPAKGFGPAAPGERCVYGARRPGYPESPVPSSEVDRWISYMNLQGVGGVVCLLTPGQMSSYENLAGSYQSSFGAGNVLLAPIEDYHLADVTTLTGRILPFLAAADLAGRKVVVHCAGGIGRTGHVLAAWLVGFRGLTNVEAIDAVRRAGRNAGESGDPGLSRLLDECRETFGGRDAAISQEKGEEHVR
jgi:protein-tyrosine phosphatase